MGTDVHAVWQAKTDDGWIDVPSEWEQDRHYLLFAFLANVRNGFGFAGVPTHEPVTPVAEPRGLPDDFAVDGDEHPLPSLDVLGPKQREYHEKYPDDYTNADGNLTFWMGDHSHSWLLGSEILAAKRSVRIRRSGVIPVKAYAEWAGGRPKEWSGGIMGKSIKVVDDGDPMDDGVTHVRVSWDDDDELDYFFDELTRMMALHGEVRLVFGFDS